MAQAIVFDPGERSDEQEVRVPIGGAFVNFKRGVPRLVGDDVARDLLGASAHLYRKATMPAPPAAEASASAEAATPTPAPGTDQE